MALPASSPAFSSSSRREARSPGRARVLCARTCACARARVAVVRERSRRGKGGGRASARSLARSPRPVRGPVSGSAAGGSRRTAALFPALALLRPLPLLASPHRERPAGVSPLSRPALPCSVPFRFLGGWCASVSPVGGKGSAPRRRPARPLAVAPGRASPDGAGVVRGSRERARRRGGGPPSRVFQPPDPCPGT